MIKSIFGFMLFFSVFSAAADEKYWLWGASTTAIVADWGTTLNGVGNPQYYERNELLGDHPSRAAINKYFTGLLAVHGLGNWLILEIPNKKIRVAATRFQNLIVISTHGSGALNNYSIGLEVDF